MCADIAQSNTPKASSYDQNTKNQKQLGSSSDITLPSVNIPSRKDSKRTQRSHINPQQDNSIEDIMKKISAAQQKIDPSWEKQEQRIIEAITEILDSKSIRIEGSALKVHPLSQAYHTFERARELGYEVKKAPGEGDWYEVSQNGKKTGFLISAASQGDSPQSEEEIITKLAGQLDKFLPNENPIDVRGTAIPEEISAPQSNRISIVPGMDLHTKSLNTKSLDTKAPIESIRKIPSSVASVQVHYPQGASTEEKQKPGRVLVHVRQMHGASALDDPSALPPSIRQDMQTYLPKAQQQIYQVLKTLLQGGIASGVYAEGMDPKTAESFRQNLKILADPKTRQSVASLEQAFGTKSSKETAKLLSQVQRNNPEPRSAQVDRAIRTLGFLYNFQTFREQVQKDPILASLVQGNFQLHPGEDERLHQQNVAYVQEHPDASVDDPAMVDLMNQRDSHLVESIGNSNADVSVAVLGAGHDLRAEVDAWNKAHPDDPITLVEVEPTAVTAYMNKQDGK